MARSFNLQKNNSFKTPTMDKYLDKIQPKLPPLRSTETLIIHAKMEKEIIENDKEPNKINMPYMQTIKRKTIMTVITHILVKFDLIYNEGSDIKEYPQ